MIRYTLPPFGDLPIENLEEYYDAYLESNGNKIHLILLFENKTIDISKMDNVKNFIEKMGEINDMNNTYILHDYNNKDGDTVKFYLEHHLRELSKDQLSNLINFDDPMIGHEQQLLTKLKLIRVRFYPERENNFAIFDYSIGQDMTNYLVVINTNPNGELENIGMES